MDPTTLFIDGLPQGISKQWVSDIFAEHGRLEDVYLSKKRRPSNSSIFGFVRFRNENDAKKAIEKLNGRVIKGKKMSVAIAKYEREKGTAQPNRREEGVRTNIQSRYIRFPSNRDYRRYVDVVKGDRSAKNYEGPKNIENRGTFRLEELKATTEKLKTAVVLEVSESLELLSAVQSLEDSNLPIKVVSAISPNELVLFMDEEDNVKKALGVASPLWSLGEAHIWSDERFEQTRTIWVEFDGIHPKWHSYDNMVKLGEKWGEVLRVVHDRDGVYSLTWARMLIKTTRRKIIDEGLIVEWESGSGEVRVKESCCCYSKCPTMVEESDGSSEEDEDNEDGADTQKIKGLFSSNNGEEEHLVNVGIDQSNSRERGEDLESLSTEMSKGKRRLEEDFSVDMALGGNLSCPAPYRGDSWFDPIASIECTLRLEGRLNCEGYEDGVGDPDDTVVNTPIVKRPRGRPKGMASSLPDTLSVPSTPVTCSLEASATWKTATKIGVSTNEESETMEEIRRSKRVQTREANNRP